MFRVNMVRGAGFTDAEWGEQLEAAYWWAKCWNDPGFQAQVKGFTYTYQSCSGALWWKKCHPVTMRGFTYTLDSGDEVLVKLLSGSETLKPEANGVADVTVVIGNEKGVLGWTNQSTLTEWISQWFVDDSTIAAQAGNRAHEYCHKVGYDHPFARTWDRDWSVPYAIGYLTEAWIEKNYVAGEWKNPPIVNAAPKVQVESVT